ncbi:MAG: hypothetical protein B6U78_01245 [Candidatus Aenigmarchaeota archaeon ex4484_224]|nr:MAG: hypothetical protein B6U78_01245 [Candidatus Aenigmarchaeota archaeon ex4484_224]
MVVISVLSGKGGVGKTTVTTNIATALTAVFKRKTLILDTNITSSHIRLHFGMYDEMKYTLKDIIKDESMLKKVIRTSELTGVDLIPSPETLKGLNLEKLKNLASQLATSEYNFVIIDSAPGFRENVPHIIKASDHVLIVTNPYLPDVTDALKLLEVVKKYKRKFTVIVNRIKKKKYELSDEQIKDMLDVKKIVEIPEDEKVPESIAAGVPIVIYKPGSKASIALKKLAASLIGEEYKPSIRERIKWFLGF